VVKSRPEIRRARVGIRKGEEKHPEQIPGARKRDLGGKKATSRVLKKNAKGKSMNTNGAFQKIVLGPTNDVREEKRDSAV